LFTERFTGKSFRFWKKALARSRVLWRFALCAGVLVSNFFSVRVKNFVGFLIAAAASALSVVLKANFLENKKFQFLMAARAHEN